MPFQSVASCRHFPWIFELCADNHIDARRIVRHVPFTVEHLLDSGTFIDWESFLQLFSNLGSYFTDERLLIAGADSWKHQNLQIYAISGRLLNNTRDQYLAMFGPKGVTTKLFPIELQVTETAAGHLTIVLSMKNKLTPCRPFHAILAGQLVGLPALMGESEAEVTIQHNANGATFEVWFNHKRGMISRIKQSLAWSVSARDTAQKLTASHDALLAQYRELWEESLQLKEAERRAIESESRYALLDQNIRDVIWITDPNMRFVYVSSSVTRLLGYSPDEIQGIHLLRILSSGSAERVRELMSVPVTDPRVSPEPTTVEVEMIHHDGSHRWAEVHANFVLDDLGRTRNVVGVARDISERKSFEAYLDEREESFRAITTTAQDAIITVNDANTITFANPAATRIFGHDYPSLIGKPLHELMPDAHHGTLLDLQAADQPAPRQAPMSTPSALLLTGRGNDGRTLSLETSFAEHSLAGERYVTWIIRDISARARVEDERKALERQLLATQRMESIGELTGGIAHDFNNLLVAINGYAELAMEEGVARDDRQQFLSEIRRAGARAADMTHKLLAFSRRQIIEPRVVNVNKLINGIERIIDRLLPEDIRVRFLPDLTDPSILADAGQIEQVIVNLAVNARDAMARGGRLTISVETRTVAAPDAIAEKRRGSEYVVIRVEDTGIGMSAEILKHIFEPFFTTKPEGAGTGLGMSVAFGIIKQHDGFIEVKSEPGEGARFEVYLPLSEERYVPSKQSPQQHPGTTRGNETLLLAEDNEQVRDLARRILEGAGYRVIEAHDGAAALSRFRDNAAAIDLVIMDVVMPKMGGKDVMTGIREMVPGIPILFTSGYSRGGIHTNFILEEGLDFISKPYDAATLRTRVRKILGARRATRPISPTAPH